MAWQEVQGASDVQDEVVVVTEEGHSPAMTVIDGEDGSMSDVNPDVHAEWGRVPWNRVFPDREWDEQMALPVQVGEWDDADFEDFEGQWVLNSPPLNTAEVYFNNDEPEPEPSPTAARCRPPPGSAARKRAR